MEKWIWISPRFVQEHRNLVEVLQHAVKRKLCIWGVLDNLEAFLQKQVEKKEHRSRYIGLITDSDRAAIPGLGGIKFACTAKEFVASTAKRDLAGSRMGVCGR